MKSITVKVYSFFKKEPVETVTIVSGRKGFLRWLKNCRYHSFEVFDENGETLDPSRILRKGGEYDS